MREEPQAEAVKKKFGRNIGLERIPIIAVDIVVVICCCCFPIVVVVR